MWRCCVRSGGGGLLSRGLVFSSRRRHTRYLRDWSSDVCSSDLGSSIPGHEGYEDLTNVNLKELAEGMMPQAGHQAKLKEPQEGLWGGRNETSGKSKCSGGGG